MQQIQKDQKDNLLSQNFAEAESKPQSQSTESKTQTLQIIKKQLDDIINPIEELVKNNNPIPLLVVIDQIDLNRKIQDKPLLSILATKFIPLAQVLKSREITFPLDEDRRTPLHYAIEADDVKAAAWLIQKGNPNQRDNFGHTPIIDAIRLGRQRCFLLCLKNKLYDERAPLFAAVYNRHWELKVLHGMGINLFAYRDQQNKSAFEKALEYNSFDSAQFMIKIRPDLKIDKFKSFSQSKGLIRRLKKIQKNMSTGQRLKQIIRPSLILLILYLGLNASIFGYTQIYESTRPFYVILMLVISCLYGLTYLIGTYFSNKVEYTDKNSLSEILRQPSYTTLQDICPVCVHFTEYRYDHCYVCGYCVDKYHFHSFVCLNKSNQIFWILGQFIWLYLSWSILHEFTNYLESIQLSISSISSFFILKLLATIQILFVQKNFIALLWLIFLVFLVLYQLIYCLALTGMMCMRRKFQQVIHSQKYLHLYHVVKVDDNYMNKQKKIFERGLCGGIIRSARNLIIYFFVTD